MKKKIKVNYPKMTATASITIPKFMAYEIQIWGDKEVEIENIGDEIIIRKCEEGLSEALKVKYMFEGTDFLDGRRKGKYDDIR